jgi:hypothetical protein
MGLYIGIHVHNDKEKGALKFTVRPHNLDEELWVWNKNFKIGLTKAIDGFNRELSPAVKQRLIEQGQNPDDL